MCDSSLRKIVPSENDVFTEQVLCVVGFRENNFSMRVFFTSEVGLTRESGAVTNENMGLSRPYEQIRVHVLSALGYVTKKNSKRLITIASFAFDGSDRRRRRCCIPIALPIPWQANRMLYETQLLCQRDSFKRLRAKPFTAT